MTNIFIANLDWEITSDDLLATFSAFGEVHLAHVVFDAKTKKSKGFGYVEMENAEQAINAIQALNGFEVNGRKLDVKIASPKSNRPKPEDKPKKKFDKKPGGFGGQKRFNNDGNRGGGYKSNNNPYRSDSKPREDRPREDRPREDRPSSSGSGERQMRPRKRFDQ